ncbi:hypothetical protein [Streptomyces sp. NBRC 110028]|uniref:hypothetical protein n=1 Tax=Streptomyces sp. NBRC 110028 TaxID=1621260 RepID=UPI0006E1DC2F|nr:hypothetical protein [Streptomyces sp. NBRC 110028]
MNIGKKAALLTAAAGALVIVGSTGASANNWLSSGTTQSNSCDTATGSIYLGSITGPTGDTNIGSDCVNFTNSRAAVQSNDCDTATGPITIGGISGPTGDLDVGSKCANIALNDNP